MTVMATAPQHDSQSFRWAVLFRDLTEPLFVLNARQRVLFVNGPWQQLAGFTLEQVRGQPCRRRRVDPGSERLPQMLAALAPPSSVRQGRSTEARRRLPLPGGYAWALID